MKISVCLVNVAANAYLANKFAEKEVIQLAENKKCKGENVVPHRSNFVKNNNYDVCHDTKIQNGGAIGCWGDHHEKGITENDRVRTLRAIHSLKRRGEYCGVLLEGGMYRESL